jgi:hypothetical protein
MKPLTQNILFILLLSIAPLLVVYDLAIHSPNRMNRRLNAPPEVLRLNDTTFQYTFNDMNVKRVAELLPKGYRVVSVSNTGHDGVNTTYILELDRSYKLEVQE